VSYAKRAELPPELPFLPDLVPTLHDRNMIDGVDVTSTFRLGPIHDAQAYI
jgi:hypothetical protein